MADLYYWPTPNGHNIIVFLKEQDALHFPWIVPWKRQQQSLDSFPHLRAWFNGIRARAATVRAYEKGEPLSAQPAVTEKGKKLLFGQAAASVARG